MYISNLKLKNFKRFDKAEFIFDDINILEGKNGTGKSSIKDAIIFCLFNRTADGLVTKTEKLIKEGEKMASVEIMLSNGETIIRNRSERSTRITYLDSSQNEEDSEINQAQIEDIIGADYDTFQCIFNVGYFMNLPDKDKRELMLKWAKPIDRMELFKKFQLTDEIIKKYHLKTSNIQGQYKEFMKEKRELERFLDITKMNIQSIEDVKIPKSGYKDQTEALQKIEEKIDETEKANREWDEYKEKLSDISIIKEKNEEIINKINEIKIEEITKPTNSKVVALYKEREKLINEREQISKISPQIILINQLKSQINELQNTTSIPEGKCPTCLQEIPVEHKDKIGKINSEIAAKKRELDKKLEQAKIVFEKEHSDIEKKIDKLKDEIQKEEVAYDDQWTKFKENEENKIEVRVLKAIIQEIKELKKPERPPVDILKLQDDLEKIKSAQEEYLIEQAEIKIAQKRKELEESKRKELDDRKNKAEEELKDIKWLCSSFSPKGIPAEEMKMKLEPIVETLNEFLPKAKVELLELMKNGMEYREVFKLYSKGKEYNRMSTGERKKSDIALSQAINKLSGKKLNMFFIDNAESIDKIPNLVAQTFLANVTQDEELKLTVSKDRENTFSPSYSPF